MSRYVSPKEKRMCRDKVRYNSQQKADRAAMRRNLRSYLCPYCGGYHLTSQEREMGDEWEKEE